MRVLAVGMLLIVLVALIASSTEAKGKRKAQGKKKAQAGPPPITQLVRPEVLRRLAKDNPGLRPDFLRTAPPDTTIKLPDGQTVPIYKLKQFQQVNFRLTFFARKSEKGSDVVPRMEERLKKLMCLPDYYQFIKKHRERYKIHGKQVSAQQAYDHFRYVNRRLGVTAGKKFKSPVGGGSGIAAPSWAVWKAMNIFHHEACHCIGINHDSGGLSGPLSGALRKWDRQKKWNYQLVDLNSLKT